MRAALTIPLLALALLAAGCGSDGDSSPASAGGEGDAAQVDEGLQVSEVGWQTDFSKHTVPLDEFQSGGPGKDGIPAIDAPTFVSVAEADEWLADREPVIQVELDGDVRVYPLQILIWHEIVNDEVAGTPIVVTFCPLCNTSLVFERTLDEQILDFGTTGNLRSSDLVMYDRQTESWWQQFGGEAVVGELAGETLEQIPARIVGWSEFAAAHPDAKVLSRDTGFGRPYGQNPYTGYDDVDSGPFFGAANSDDQRLPPKERVVFIERDGDAVVIPISGLAEEKSVTVEVGGEKLEVTLSGAANSALDSSEIAEGREVGTTEVRSVETGELVPFDEPFWFAVAAFRPDVRIVGESVAENSSFESGSGDAPDPAQQKRGPTTGRVIAG